MAKKKKEIIEESIEEEIEKEIEEVLTKPNEYIGKDGQKYQRPDPVVPIEDAVAKDSPIYENLPEEVK
jgi:hypothetical protein